jgi:hypothetical protein
MARLSFEPLIPASLWLLLAVAAAVLLVWYGLSRPGRIGWWPWVGIMALMAGAVASVLVVLLNPTWIDPIEPPAGKPLLTVLVDDSSSMAVRDAADNRSRFDVAKDVARSMESRLQTRFDVRVRSFSTGLAGSDVDPASSSGPRGTLTDIAAGLAGSVEQNRPAGQALVLVSDGIHNATAGNRDVLNAVRVARSAGAPIFTLTTGRSDTPELFDREAQIRSPQQLAYVSQKVPVVVRVRERATTTVSAHVAGGVVTVSLFEEGKPIGQQEVALPPGGVAEAKFTVSHDAPGVYRYEARIEPAPGELIGANNTAVQFLQVVNEPIRVLLLEGKPYWDSKFLMRTLAADPVVALDSVVRMTENRYLQRTLRPADALATSAPAADAPVGTPEGHQERWKVVDSAANLLSSADALKEYQVVVLGRDTEVFLSDAATNNIRQWMSRQGGSLVCYRGSPAVQASEKLAQIMPVQWSEASESRFRVQLTEDARTVRWLGDLDDQLEGGVLSRLPSLATVSRVDKPRPLAMVLATAAAAGTGESWPVVSCQNYGTGRVVAIEGAGMWRWAFLPPQHAEYAGIYGTLWQSLMRWLVSGTALRPGQKMDLRCDEVVFDASDPASARLLLGEAAMAGGVPSVELRLAGDGNAIGTFAPAAAGTDPGTFRVVFGKLPPGQYEARIVPGSGASPPPDARAGTSASPQADGTPVARFDVRAPVREQLELAARPDLMARVAEDSGGAVLRQGTAGEVIELFDAYNARTRPQRVRRIPAWDRWYVLMGVLGVWAVCWGVRRASGLI